MAVTQGMEITLLAEGPDAATAVAVGSAELEKAKNAKDGDRDLSELADTVEQAGGRRRAGSGRRSRLRRRGCRAVRGAA